MDEVRDGTDGPGANARDATRECGQCFKLKGVFISALQHSSDSLKLGHARDETARAAVLRVRRLVHAGDVLHR